MSTKSIVSILVVIIVLVLIALGLSALGDGNIEPPENSGGVSEEAVEEFIEVTRGKVVSEIGQPIEGFEPFMFMRVYPGLEEQDFDGVDALIGSYQYENGELTYDLGEEREVHSAARAISDEGMAGLLSNVVNRLSIDLEEGAVIDTVIEAIEEDGNEAVGETVAVVGEVVCLPHKDQDGPQTLECALGLKAENGDHYGLITPGRPFSPELTETGNRVRVSGTVTPPQPTNIYAVVGIINVESVVGL